MAKERLPISCPPAPKEFKFKYKDKDGKDQEGTAKYPPELNQWFESVRTMLDVAYGVRREAEALRFVTLQELVNTGLMQASLTNGTKLKKADNVTGSLEIDLPNVSVDDRIPDLPTNFAATATFRSIILTWDLPSYPNHDYTEVWRNTSNNLSTATLHMSVGSGVASDAVGTGATYYYWLRNVGTNGKRSSYTNVVSGTTTTLPGTEITSIAATKVTTGTLAADVILSSSIGAGQITAGTIGSHTIYLNGASSVIQSSNFDASNGWQIKGDGNATFRNATVRGVLNAADISAGTLSRLRAPEPRGILKMTSSSAYINSGSHPVADAGTTTRFYCNSITAYDANFSVFNSGDSLVNNSGHYVEWNITAEITLYSTSATAAKRGSYFLQYTTSADSHTSYNGTGTQAYFYVPAGSSNYSTVVVANRTVYVPSGVTIKPLVAITNDSAAGDGDVGFFQAALVVQYVVDMAT